ncbi:MAG: hypothetical protein KAS52_04130 [Candidatus Heimdallarchaeota archaeon]|nr:hypothetical protein [Candidatus Heimdallarchaeota archaeon]
MPKLTYDQELKEIFDSFLLEIPEVEPGNAFGLPGYYIYGKLFASAFESGMVLKLPKERCDHLIQNEDGFDYFAPLGNKMKQWVVMTKDDPESFENEMNLILESIKFVREEALKS